MRGGKNIKINYNYFLYFIKIILVELNLTYILIDFWYIILIQIKKYLSELNTDNNTGTKTDANKRVFNLKQIHMHVILNNYTGTRILTFIDLCIFFTRTLTRFC